MNPIACMMAWWRHPHTCDDTSTLTYMCWYGFKNMVNMPACTWLWGKGGECGTWHHWFLNEVDDTLKCGNELWTNDKKTHYENGCLCEKLKLKL